MDVDTGIFDLLGRWSPRLSATSILKTSSTGIGKYETFYASHPFY